MSDEAGNAPHILVVDDEPGVRALVARWLERLGYQPLEAPNGVEGARAYLGHPGVALVLLDVQMPGGDGPATLALLRAIDPQVRCCFITGGAGRYSEKQLLDLGSTAVLFKPFTESHLADMLRQTLGRT